MGEIVPLKSGCWTVNWEPVLKRWKLYWGMGLERKLLPKVFGKYATVGDDIVDDGKTDDIVDDEITGDDIVDDGITEDDMPDNGMAEDGKIEDEIDEDGTIVVETVEDGKLDDGKAKVEGNVW